MAENESELDEMVRKYREAKAKKRGQYVIPLPESIPMPAEIPPAAQAEPPWLTDPRPAEEYGPPTAPTYTPDPVIEPPWATPARASEGIPSWPKDQPSTTPSLKSLPPRTILDDAAAWLWPLTKAGEAGIGIAGKAAGGVGDVAGFVAGKYAEQAKKEMGAPP